MTQITGAEIYTAAELAQGAGVPVSAVQAAVAAGELRPLADTGFFSHADAVRIGRRLREIAVAGIDPEAHVRVPAGNRRALASSSALHLCVLVVITSMMTGEAPSAEITEPVDTARLVFLVTPGPGGGGGGGGKRSPVRAPRLERRGPEVQKISVPEIAPQPTEPPPVPPEPLESRTIVAPVVAAASAPQDADVQTPGPGMGEGTGSGIGDGYGGGTGGGPYRPGSGIEPPRLLKEIKASYTDEARRANVRGDVLLEIVVRRDGSVGDVTVLKGLGYGLEQRAIAAVRQWQFAPARRQGAAVDVVVEVAVEFSLR